MGLMKQMGMMVPISQLCEGGNERLKDLFREEATKAELKAGSQMSCPILVWFGLEQWVPTRDDLGPLGTVGNVWRHFGLP